MGAENSTCTYILGYGSRPFIPQSHGFLTTMCAMRDQSSACWDTYKYGFCHSRKTCPRSHPTCVVPLHVVLCHAECRTADTNPNGLVEELRLTSRGTKSVEHLEM